MLFKKLSAAYMLLGEGIFKNEVTTFNHI